MYQKSSHALLSYNSLNNGNKDVDGSVYINQNINDNDNKMTKAHTITTILTTFKTETEK